MTSSIVRYDVTIILTSVSGVLENKSDRIFSLLVCLSFEGSKIRGNSSLSSYTVHVYMPSSSFFSNIPAENNEQLVYQRPSSIAINTDHLKSVVGDLQWLKLKEPIYHNG